MYFNFIIDFTSKGNYPQSRALKKKPFRKGIITRLCIRTPRKPNSARRQCVKLTYKMRIYLISSIAGRGHTLKRFGRVLARGGGARDLPAIYTRCIRGKFDLIGIFTKKRRRSIYGVKKVMYISFSSK